MTDELLCPYCEKPLHCGAQLDSDGHIIELYQCANPECESTEFLVGCREFWDILGQHRRTRKALDVALNAMKSAGTHNSINCIARGEDPSKDDVGITINRALNEITALEQKD